jgi:hypothetical protein
MEDEHPLPLSAVLAGVLICVTGTLGIVAWAVWLLG